MNHTSFLRSRRFFLVAAVCSLALFCLHSPGIAAEKAAPAPAKSQADGHLVIVRAANLGSQVFGLSIDGKQVAKINFGGRYNAPIAAGPHTISTIPIPDSEHAGPSDRKLMVEPGKTYTFTAKRDDVRIALK